MKDVLIFEWPGRHHLHLMLPAAIVLAAILHAGLFFAFSIIYPRPENAGLNPAQVYFIPATAADAPRLEGLLRSSDPAVFAPGRGLDLPEPVPPAAYMPRYASDNLTLDPLPHSTNSARALHSFAGPVTVRLRDSKPAGSPPPQSPTRVVSTDALAGRFPALPEGVVFSVPQGFDPEAAVFLIAVRADGQVKNIFQQHSSGNAGLDLRAASLLRGLKLAADPAGESWGSATFQWGTDVHPLAPQ
jgi:hypothetical protein